MPAPIVPRPTTPTFRIWSAIAKVRNEPLRLDHDRGEAAVAARLVLLAGVPVDRRPGADRNSLAVGALRPTRAIDDDEELVDRRRMPAQQAAGAEPEADEVRIADGKGQRDGCRGPAAEPGNRQRPIRAEVQDLQARDLARTATDDLLRIAHAAASISLRADSNCSSLRRMCECRQRLCGKMPAASTGGALSRSATTVTGRIG